MLRVVARIDSFIKTSEFSAYPKYEKNIDSLKSALASKPVDLIEGTYHYVNFTMSGFLNAVTKSMLHRTLSQAEISP
jgi:hypothetical protein